MLAARGAFPWPQALASGLLAAQRRKEPHGRSFFPRTQGTLRHDGIRSNSGALPAPERCDHVRFYPPAVSVSDEARAEVNGLKASRFFSLAERLNASATPFVWLFIRPPWSVSGSCCKAVVHESLRAECQLPRVSPGTPRGPQASGA